MDHVIYQDIAVPSDISFFILEDTEMYQKKLLTTLAQLGFKGKVTVTATLAEAVTHLTKSKPGFILSDWNLPDGKGIDFLRIVRANDAYKDVPFVMVTTMDSIDDILEAVTIGADDYIVKPWEEHELAEKIAFSYAKRMNDLNQL
jgi:two-component system chemotaxis response regulator CheY